MDWASAGRADKNPATSNKTTRALPETALGRIDWIESTGTTIVGGIVYFAIQDNASNSR
jgi:hypothetical protein